MKVDAFRSKAFQPAAAQSVLYGIKKTLAHELGHLALALEQAGAYIAKLRLGFAQYLDQWRSRQATVLGWYDTRLMQYPRSVAITWQTSFDQLQPAARRLLQRLAWLAPDPIPATLLDVPIPGEDTDLRDALAELEALSLASWSDDGTAFAVHRLVQAVTRHGQADNCEKPALGEAQDWLNAAFIGDPEDVRNWPVLDPLAPHAQSVATHAADNQLGGPSARLFNQAGVLLLAKARYAEAEPLMRRALTIDEASFGSSKDGTTSRQPPDISENCFGCQKIKSSGAQTTLPLTYPLQWVGFSGIKVSGFVIQTANLPSLHSIRR